MNKSTTLSTKIGNKNVTVKTVLIDVTDTHITHQVPTELEALRVSYCYRGQMTKIESAVDGSFLVVIYKKL